MSIPRITQSTETARAAALQAEFNEKKWVWVPDEKDGYLAGWVREEDGDFGDVVMATGGDVRLQPMLCLCHCTNGTQRSEGCRYMYFPR